MACGERLTELILERFKYMVLILLKQRKSVRRGPTSSTVVLRVNEREALTLRDCCHVTQRRDSNSTFILLDLQCWCIKEL